MHLIYSVIGMGYCPVDHLLLHMLTLEKIEYIILLQQFFISSYRIANNWTVLMAERLSKLMELHCHNDNE
jgi:hypothetical protein